MTSYLKINQNTGERRVVNRHPGWKISEQTGVDSNGTPLYAPGRLLTDDELAAQGWIPIIDTLPVFDNETQYVTKDPVEEWTISQTGDDLSSRRAYVTYTIHEYTYQELRERNGLTATQKSSKVTLKRDALIGGGVALDFGEPYGVKVLQTATEYDRMNWLTILTSAQVFAGMGQGELPMNPIRTLDNVMIPVSVNQSIALMLTMQSKLGAVWKYAADLKDEIAAAEDDAALDAIDIETGWPNPLEVGSNG